MNHHVAIRLAGVTWRQLVRWYAACWLLSFGAVLLFAFVQEFVQRDGVQPGAPLLGLAYATLLTAFFSPFFALFSLAAIWRSRSNWLTADECIKCAYDLRGIRGEICPECGTHAFNHNSTTPTETADA